MESQQAELELTYIKRVIESSRKSLVEKGVGYIFWGVLVVIGIGLQYSKFFFKIPLLHGYEWFVIIGFGWLVTFFFIKGKEVIKIVHHSDSKYLVLCGLVPVLVWGSLDL